jgi:hypothetical protein
MFCALGVRPCVDGSENNQGKGKRKKGGVRLRGSIQHGPMGLLTSLNLPKVLMT